MTKKPLRKVYAPLDRALVPLLIKELPKDCRLLITHFSVVSLLKKLTENLKNSSEVMSAICAVLQTDTRNAVKKKLHTLKLLLEPNLPVYQKFLKQIYKYKQHWMLHEFSDIFTGGLHSYNRAATIDMKLKAPLPVKVD
jgi:predicted transcriptional regulator